ncbi:MAG: 50S ribosomal protein L13 [Anaerolineae bacterium]|nr:50S ribosomal protein L13 [Anaerolineae bacterium]
MRTYVTKPAEVTREWYVVDANGKTLGRLATEIARVLRGKHKPIFQPNIDTGDFVIVVNADKVVVTGNKINDKFYYRHSGYPGGLKAVSLRDMLATHPDRVVRAAVWGMLPHTRLGRQQIKKLKVYARADHPHAAQQPKPLPL